MLCRLCLEESASITLFDCHGNRSQITNLIDLHINIIQLQNDDPISKSICDECCKQVTNFNAFYTKIETAQEKYVKVFDSLVQDPLKSHVKTEEFEMVTYSNTETSSEDVKKEEITVSEEDSSRESLANLEENVISPLKVATEISEPVKSSETIKRGSTAKDLKALNAKINSFKVLECGICGLEFETFTILTNHSKTVHKKRGFIRCCEKKFETIIGLADHVDFHLNPDIFKCKICDRQCNSKFLLESHMLKHGVKSEASTFECEYCQKKFLRKYLLNTHIRVMHDKAGEGEFRCDKCKFVCARKFRLRNHKNKVHREEKIVCHLCSKMFKSKDSLNYHFMAAHDETNQNKQQCHECGSWLPHKHALRAHIRNRHTNRTIQCNECEENFKTSSQKSRHMEEKHGAIPVTFDCTSCDRNFKTNALLKEHMAGHLGLSIHKCPYCPFTFMNSGSKTRHLKKIHAKDYEENKQGTLSYLLAGGKNKNNPTKYYALTNRRTLQYFEKKEDESNPV